MIRPGERVVKPRPTPNTPVKEVQVSISVNAGLREEDRRQAIWSLLYGLVIRVGEGASHIQATVRIVLPEAGVEEFKKLAAEALITVSVTPLSWSIVPRVDAASLPQFVVAAVSPRIGTP